MYRRYRVWLRETGQVMAEHVIGFEIQSVDIRRYVRLAHYTFADGYERLPRVYPAQSPAEAEIHFAGGCAIDPQDVLYDGRVLQWRDVVHRQSIHGLIARVALPYDVDYLPEVIDDRQHQNTRAAAGIHMLDAPDEGMVERRDDRPSSDSEILQTRSDALDVFPASDVRRLQLKIGNSLSSRCM